MLSISEQWRASWWRLAGTCVLACVVVLVGYALWWPHSYVLTYSETDDALYRGFYAAETNTAGVTYHWTAAAARVLVPRTSWTPLAILEMHVLDSARPLTMHVGAVAVPITTSRHIKLLVAHTQGMQTRVPIQAPALTQAGDDRALGVRVAWAGVHHIGAAIPAPQWFVMVCWLVVVSVVSGHLLGMAPRYAWLGAIVVPALVLWALHHNPSFATQWMWGWCVTWGIGGVGIVLMRRLLPQMPLRVQIVVWVVLCVRLIAITYPGFEGNDYVIHAKRLLTMTEQHQWTVLDYPFEFNRRPALIVPVFYLLARVLEPVFGTYLAMNIIAVCAETTTALVIWMLLTQTGVPRRVAALTTIVTLVMPLSSAILWWSFFPQILAHLCVFALMVSVVRRDMRGAWWAGVWCAVIAWTHIGEILIAAVWYLWARLLEPDRGTPAWWWRWVPVATLPLSALIVYVPYLQFLLNSTSPTVAPAIPVTWAQRMAQLQVAFAVGFAPIPWILFPILWGIAWRRAPQVARPWILTGVSWLVVELVTAYQVRYIYLTMPVMALAFSFLLAPLWQRHRAGQIFVVVIVAAMAWMTCAHWYDATLLGYRMRVDGLSH